METRVIWNNLISTAYLLCQISRVCTWFVSHIIPIIRKRRGLPHYSKPTTKRSNGGSTWVPTLGPELTCISLFLPTSYLGAFGRFCLLWFPKRQAVVPSPKLSYCVLFLFHNERCRHTALKRHSSLLSHAPFSISRPSEASFTSSFKSFLGLTRLFLSGGTSYSVISGSRSSFRQVCIILTATFLDSIHYVVLFVYTHLSFGFTRSSSFTFFIF